MQLNPAPYHGVLRALKQTTKRLLAEGIGDSGMAPERRLISLQLDPEAPASNELVCVPTDLATPALAQRFVARLSITAAAQPTPVEAVALSTVEQEPGGGSEHAGKGVAKRKRGAEPGETGVTPRALF